MLNLLTKYLLQYRQVSIPSVGTVRLVQSPAQLNVADKVLHPPSFAAELTADSSRVPDHQIWFLSAALHQEKEAVLKSLQSLGEQMSGPVSGDGFDWKGIGLIKRNAAPVSLRLQAFTPVLAERVLRHDAEHSVLVGDRQRMVGPANAVPAEPEPETAEKKRSPLIIVGWVLLILSILYILFVLFRGGFKIGSTGSHQAPTSREVVMTETHRTA